jgi:hypothetical protein
MPAWKEEAMIKRQAHSRQCVLLSQATMGRNARKEFLAGHFQLHSQRHLALGVSLENICAGLVEN